MTKNEYLYGIKRPNLRGQPHNKTTLFMLPSIGFTEEKTSVRLLKYYGFINCYLSHTQALETYPGCLSLVFNPTNEALAKFKEFYHIYRTYPNFVDDYPIDHNLIVVVFRVLPKWQESLAEFKKSRYSHMSKDYANLFKKVNMSSGVTKATDEYFIMNKDKDYKQKLEESLSLYEGAYRSPVVIETSAELLGPLDLTKEIFTYGIT